MRNVTRKVEKLHEKKEKKVFRREVERRLGGKDFEKMKEQGV